MEGSNDIFLAGNDVLGKLAGSMHKIYFMVFTWGYQFSTCGSYDQFFNPSNIPPCAHINVFKVTKLL